MDKFTSGERRGTIAVVGVIAAVVVYLAVSRSLHSIVPAPACDTLTSIVISEDEKTTNNKIDTITKPRMKKRKSSGRKPKPRRKSHVQPDRDPLSEPVD